MILITGISRAGKTSTAQLAVARFSDLKYISASALLKESGAKTYDLSPENVKNNQSKIVEALKQHEYWDQKNIVLDGHAIIETENGVVELPNSLFDRLQLETIICIKSSPEEIFGRRKGVSQVVSISEISDRQNRECAYSKYQATRLSIPYFELLSGEFEALIGIVKGLRA